MAGDSIFINTRSEAAAIVACAGVVPLADAEEVAHGLAEIARMCWCGQLQAIA